METAGAVTAISKDGLVESFRADKLNVYVYDTRAKMGAAAAAAVAAELRRLIEAQGRAAAVFASAPSQNEFLAARRRLPPGRVPGHGRECPAILPPFFSRAPCRESCAQRVSRPARRGRGRPRGVRALRPTPRGRAAGLRRARHRRERAPGLH